MRHFCWVYLVVQINRIANGSDRASDCASLDLFAPQKNPFATSLQILTSSGPGLEMGYPVAQGPLPKMRRRCSNFASVFPNFSWSIPIFHCSNLHPQHGKQFHTNLVCGVEHGPRGLVWDRKFVIKQEQKVIISFTMPLWFTTKQV